MNFTTCLIVMIGGSAGTLLRYIISLITLPISSEIPWGTIFTNVSGSFLIGFFGTLTLAAGKYPISENWRLFVMVGLCGGFTTFSAFSLQTLDLLRSGAICRATFNAIASVLLCVCATAAGHLIAAKLNGGAVSIAQIAIEEDA